jgi:putative endonuclease
MKTTCYSVYILLCDNGAYYTGYTTDLKRRYQEHVEGTGKCKFTKSFKPLRIAQSWEIQGSKSLAMKIEKRIKMLSKKEKEQLILQPDLQVYFGDFGTGASETALPENLKSSTLSNNKRPGI